jgi:hypothetical protein
MSCFEKEVFSKKKQIAYEIVAELGGEHGPMPP